MKLILTRHGQTEENLHGIIHGHLPGTLTGEGIRQARQLASRLKNERVDVIYSSDLARASDTAKAIAEFHPNTPLKFTRELRERYLGELEGIAKESLGYPADYCLAGVLTPKDGETLEELFERAEKFLNVVLHRHKDETILVVGHNGINNAILAVITGKRAGDLREMVTLKNAGVSVIEIDDGTGSHRMRTFDSDEHLKQASKGRV